MPILMQHRKNKVQVNKENELSSLLEISLTISMFDWNTLNYCLWQKVR